MVQIKTWGIGEVAQMAGVSVRMLRHWDKRGLLRPAIRRPNGYRRYDSDDLLRLQQIGLMRRTGIGLADIAKALNTPGFDHRALLQQQRQHLQLHMDSTAALLAGVDAALALLDGKDIDMTELFDGFNPEDFADEAKARWGDTPAYAESARRTKSYTPQDWAQIKAEQDSCYAAIAAAMRAGTAPTSADGIALAARHRALIDRYFYPCSVETHKNLADLYAQDDRFRSAMDAHGAGLTDWLIAAIRAC